MPSSRDLAARVGGELEVLERDALDPGGQLVAGDGADVEQHRRWVERERWIWTCLVLS